MGTLLGGLGARRIGLLCARCAQARCKLAGLIVAALIIGSAGPALAQGFSIFDFSKSFGAATIFVGNSTSLTFTLTNNDEVPLPGVTFDDALPAGLVVASPSSLSSNASCVGGTMTAAPGSGNISWTGGSIPAGASCVISVNVTGTTAGTKNNSVTATSGSGPATATASIVVVAPPTLSRLTIIVAAIGRDGAFSFTSTVPGAGSFTLTTTGGTASQQFSNVPAGTYTVTQAPPPLGFSLTSVQCDAGPQTPPTATVTLTGANSVTCTFTDTFDAQGIQTATQSVIRNFLQHRANAITNSEPDGTRGDGRLSGWLFGDGNGGQQGGALGAPNPLLGRDDASAVRRSAREAGRRGDDDAGAGGANAFRLSGSADDGAGTILFSTSLSQMRQVAATFEAARAEDGNAVMMGLGRTPQSPPGPAVARGQQPPTYDVWMEGHINYFDDNRAASKQSGHTHLLYVGADYRLGPAILVGVLAQFDWAGESSGALNTSAEGNGWMAGPYVAMRLTRNISFDGRAAWGSSRDHVNPFGLFEDSFSTRRSLVSGRLVGNWFWGPMRFSPGASLIYFRETQNDYVDAINVPIPGQTVELGRFSFGPEVGYRFRQSDGGVLEPFVGLKGIWDFARDGTTTVGPFVVGNDAWHGKVEAGAILHTPWGATVRGTAAYDGIGEKNFSLYQGRLLVTVPLN